MSIFNPGSIKVTGSVLQFSPKSPVDNSGEIKVCPYTDVEYEKKYNKARVLEVYKNTLKSLVNYIVTNKGRYLSVERNTGVPWWVVAGIHFKESSGDFKTYLQNGDPLFNASGLAIPTKHVPVGVGPFDPQDWENAAVHALGGPEAHRASGGSLGCWLRFCEAYNGYGYRKRGVATPYLWSGTDQYSKGYFTADGVFNPQAVAKSPGVVPIAKLLFSESPLLGA